MGKMGKMEIFNINTNIYFLGVYKLCIRLYFIDFNKLSPKKGQFRVETFLWLKNCNLLDIQNLLLLPRNPFRASHQGVLEGPVGPEGPRGLVVPGLGPTFSPCPIIHLNGGNCGEI